jgi:hypothetical protein
VFDQPWSRWEFEWGKFKSGVKKVRVVLKVDASILLGKYADG